MRRFGCLDLRHSTDRITGRNRDTLSRFETLRWLKRQRASHSKYFGASQGENPAWREPNTEPRGQRPGLEDPQTRQQQHNGCQSQSAINDLSLVRLLHCYRERAGVGIVHGWPLFPMQPGDVLVAPQLRCDAFPRSGARVSGPLHLRRTFLVRDALNFQMAGVLPRIAYRRIERKFSRA